MRAPRADYNTLTLHALLPGDRLLLALARAGVASCPLTTHGQAATMPFTPVTANLAQSLNVLLNLTTQHAFHHVTAVEDLGDAADFLIIQVLGPLFAVNARLRENVVGILRSDAVNVPQR